MLRSPTHAQPPLDEALELATKAAIAKAAPAIVQIRTIGGLDTLGQGQRTILKGQGPTTGIIVSEDGYVVSSSFNFANKPAAITVTVPGGKEPLNARIVAQDKTRQLTLLKVEATGLPTPTPAPKDEVQVGQWALALGKVWGEGASASPSVSVGIVSAKERVWGRAIQTDAKVSPINYGGPLVDLRGRVIGILVPLSPQASDETAGVEWYDGGIGFAIPLEDFNRIFPKLKESKDLKKGVLGIRLKSNDRYSVVPTVASVAIGSAAAKAGIQPGDEIVGIDDKPVGRTAQFMHVLDNKYEGDKVSLKLKRGEQTVNLPNVELTGPPASQVLAFLGVLPLRDDGQPGVGIRYVFKGSPAAEAGIKAGDRLMMLEKRPIPNRNALLGALASRQPGEELEFSVQRTELKKTETMKIKLGEMTAVVPDDDLPEASLKQALAKPPPPAGPGGRPGRPQAPPADEQKPPEKKDAPKGFITNADLVSGRASWVYVPDDYDPNVSHGILVWLHPAGQPMDEVLKKTWRDLCNKHHLILLAPKAENPQGWLTSEADFVTHEIRKLQDTYTIDPQRIVLHGLGNGANFALYLAFDARDLVRGVASFGGILNGPPKENQPDQRLSFFLVIGAKDPNVEAIRAAKPALVEKHFPVVSHELADQGDGYVTDASVLRELVRWMDALDRL
jgi:S1-C subfamily serine protease/predicted esterase